MGRTEIEENKVREDNRKRRHNSPSLSRSRSMSTSRSESRELARTKKHKPRRDNHPPDDRKVSRTLPRPSNNESSISIEETNRLRMKLGLKPLEVVDGCETTTATERKDVHVRPENLGDVKATEELRRKLEERREKRKIEQRLSKVKTLADDDDDASNWVEKSRKIQQAKDDALKRARMMEDMDRVFGAEQTEPAATEKASSYTEKHLIGLKVEHDRESIAEGRAVVMTLKDQYVLEGGEDVLVNVNMVDEERYKKNNQVKKQKIGYQAYEEEVDGLPRTESLLAKYDAEIDGERKDSFVLGRAGDGESKRRAAELIKDKLKLERRKMETLQCQPPRMASDYLTEQEMADGRSFRKVTRRVRKVRSKGLTAGDLLKEGASAGSDDLGCRSRNVETPEGADLRDLKFTAEENQLELHRALEKAKRWKQRDGDELGWNTEAAIRSIKSEPVDPTDGQEEEDKGIITMNPLSEYCRRLGDLPTYGMAGNRDEDEDEEELLDFERRMADERKKNLEKEERQRRAERLQERGGWNVVDDSVSLDVDHEASSRPTPSESNVILDEEPTAGSGMAAALRLAISKGYLEKEKVKRATVSKMPEELLAKPVIDDKVNGSDDKFSRKNHDRFDGPVTEFKEKEGYRPTVKLEYVDDEGQSLDTKEAFRHLSHKFHGKCSGKLKLEKRAKKRQDEMRISNMKSTDTPLNSMRKLQNKLKKQQSPYVVLSGKNALPITKPK